MTSQPTEPDRHIRWVALAGFALAMGIIISLWILLLPGELSLISRQSDRSGFWAGLDRDRQAASQGWQETKESVMSTWNQVVQQGQAQEAARQASLQADGPRAEEIRAFRQSLLESTTVENANR